MSAGPGSSSSSRGAAGPDAPAVSVTSQGTYGGYRLAARVRDSLATELSPAVHLFGGPIPSAPAVAITSSSPRPRPRSLTGRPNKQRARRSFLYSGEPTTRPEPPDARLISDSALGVRSVFQLKRGVTTIGRKDDNDIVLSCAKISKHHAVVELVPTGCADDDPETDDADPHDKDRDDRSRGRKLSQDENDGYNDGESGIAAETPGWAYVLRDLNSSNGVRVDDVYVTTRTPLSDGNVIQIGSITLTFQELVDEAPPPQQQQTYNDAASSPQSSNAPRQRSAIPARGTSSLNSSSSNSSLNSSSSSISSQRRVEQNQPSRSHYASQKPQQLVAQDTRRPSYSLQPEKLRGLVKILPSEKPYEESFSIRAELDEPAEPDFPAIEEIDDIEVLKQDYEKLRLAYELSKFSSFTSNVSDHLTRMLELMFSVLPVDRGVVLLVDTATSMLVTSMVKVREGKNYDGRDIMLSSTIINRVYETRKCLITSDACEDPDLGKSSSIARNRIRSVICVPIVAHEDVLGILHLDSRDRINAFIEKDLALVQTIINQTALQIENSIMFAQRQTEIRVTEQLKRFLPPQVVERMVKKEEVIHKGGREINGTIIFADIRGFTNLSERSSPGEVFNLLNEYFERLVKIVFKYNGVVDKFIGDALMAVFGTLDNSSRDLRPSVLNSVLAALEFKKAIRDMSQERIRHKLEPIEIGVGLNTGRLMAGFMGSSQRLEYTCIGDTVNLASRICGAAEENQVLISEDTKRYIEGRIETRFIGTRQFKGKERETRVYEALRAIEDTADADVSSSNIEEDMRMNGANETARSRGPSATPRRRSGGNSNNYYAK